MLFLFGCVLLVLFSLSTFFSLLNILFSSADTGVLIYGFCIQLFWTLVLAYFMRKPISKRLSQGSRRKTDKQRLNQLQLLPPNAALPAIQPQNIIALDPDEEAYASVDVILQEMRSHGSETHVSGSAVNWGGFTSVGGSSHTHNVSKMESVAQGEMLITPKRLIFSGNMQTFIFPLNEILGILPTEEGFIINSSYNNRTIEIKSEIQRQIFDCVIRRVLQYRQG